MSVTNRTVQMLVAALAVGVLTAALPAAADAKVRCANFTNTGTLQLFGKDVARLHISKRLCRNGKRITTRSKNMSIRPEITGVGRAFNVEFDKLVVPPVSNYGSWRGRRHARWYGYALGRFRSKLCGGPLGCSEQSYQLSVRMTVYGDYTRTKRSSGG